MKLQKIDRTLRKYEMSMVTFKTIRTRKMKHRCQRDMKMIENLQIRKDLGVISLRR
jgi:hypothetical protein